VALAAGTLAGCTSSAVTAGGGPHRIERSHVRVDTAALRAAKKRAGIENCPRTSGAISASLPNLTLPCLGGGRSVDVARLKGPMVINLWASWCGPCRAELPFYEKLHRRSRGVLSVVGIDYLDTRPDQALSLAADTGVTYPLIADPDGALRAPFRARFLPGVVLVNAKGAVNDVEYVSVRSYHELTSLVREHLHVALPRR
jgi:thiol-disulfide isomerase/thioredoxin